MEKQRGSDDLELIALVGFSQKDTGIFETPEISRTRNLLNKAAKIDWMIALGQNDIHRIEYTYITTQGDCLEARFYM